jgi:hypothetical protein
MTDQEMLRLMGVRGTAELSKLAAAILSSESAAAVFEYFADGSTTPLLLPLLSEIYAQLRRRDDAGADLKNAEGSFAPWRLAQRRLGWETIEPWLIGEVIKNAPNHLRLLNSIYYYWTAGENHSRSQREPVRAAVHRVCKERMADAPSQVVCGGFDPAFPWILFHLVFTTEYEKPEAVPFGTARDWDWLARALLEASESCPSTLLPQLVIATNTWESRQKTVIDYTFNEELLVLWFGDKRERFLRSVISLDAGSLKTEDANAVAYFQAAQKDAAEKLQKIRE